MIGNYVNEWRLCNGTIFLTRVYSRALMQFPRYPAGLSRFVQFQRVFFKSPLKTSTELGLRHGRGKTNRVTLIIYAEFRKPEGISNSDARGRRYVRPMRDTQKEKNISKAASVADDRKGICSVVTKRQSYF